MQEEVDHHPQSSRHILISLINLTTEHCCAVIEENLIKVQLILNSSTECLPDGLVGFYPARKYLGWESIIRVKLELISFFSAGVVEVGKKDPRLLYKAGSHPTGGAPQSSD